MLPNEHKALNRVHRDRQAAQSHLQQQKQKALGLGMVQNTCNALAPIHRLPSEILCMIFALVIDHSEAHPFRNLRSIQLVCRLWRQLAISCPSCWTSIYVGVMTSSWMLGTLLDRAGGLPLHCYARLADDLLEYLAPHIGRVRTLQVIFEDEQIAPCDFFGLFSRQAPMLEGLCISVANPQPHIDMPTLFDGCAPRLSHLSLSYHYVCATNRFPLLTHLYLHEQYTLSPESLSDLLDFLDGSPMLEELVLDSAGPYVPPELLDTFPLSRSVVLSRLRRVIFRECSWEVTACVLRHVVPAPHVEIRVDGLMQLTRTAELFCIFAAGATFLQHVHDPTQLAVWCLDEHLCIRCATPSASVTLGIGLYYELPDSMQISALLNDLPGVLSLSGVTDFRVHIDHAAHIWAPAVRVLCSALPAVEAFTLGLDPELTDRYWRPILASKFHPLIFPRLRAWHVVGKLPSAWRPYWVMGRAISRAKRGRPLDELTFSVLADELCGPNMIVTWPPETVHVGGHRMADFVNKLEFRKATDETSGVSLPVIKGWNGDVRMYSGLI